MAGDWIRMRVDLRDDPAVFKLAERLGVDEMHVIGCLFCFWAWADKHSVDGVVDGATTRLVDKITSTNGFADALASVGWLVISETGLQIPKFDRHNGESGKERSQKNARQARWRASKSGNVDGNVDGVASTAASTEASTREEKRREEKNKSEKTASLRAADLVALGVTEQVALDFLAVRKAKRAPLTQTALASIQREAESAKVSLDDALAVCASRGWQSFKADWMTDKPLANQAATQADAASPYRYFRP